MPETYERLKPAEYAMRRLVLRMRVQDGETVETAARGLNIPRSTARLWAAQDGFRLMDRAADAAGAPRADVGGWAKPGRRRMRAAPAPAPGEGGLPPTDYPELQGLSPRGRLAALSRLADVAEMRAVAGIEEGCITFGLASLREAMRLRRAWRVLQDAMAQYPETDEADADAYEWHDDFAEEIAAREEGRAPVHPPPPLRAKTAGELAEAEIWLAVEAAEAEDLARLGLTADSMTIEAFALRQLDLYGEVRRLMDARARWMCLPGRGPPEIVVRLPERGREWLK